MYQTKHIPIRTCVGCGAKEPQKNFIKIIRTKEKSIVIKLNNISDKDKEFLDPFRIESVVKKYSDHIDFPIFLSYEETEYDDEGKEKLIEVLSEEEELNVFLISHDFTHPLIDKLSIIKENNISVIQ